MLLAVDHAQEWMQLVMDAGTAYQRLLTGGGRAAYPRYTSIVEIRHGDAPSEVLFINVCEQRLFVSRLLKEIGSAHPAVIVLDKFFSPGTCDAKPEGTQALMSVVEGLLDEGIPVVVGMEISDPEYVLRPTLKFPPTQRGQTVREGAGTLHLDKRRVPLLWPNVDDGLGKSRDVETLSLKAALARTSDLLAVSPRLGRFYRANVAPFAGFLPEKAFEPHIFSAMRILCGESADMRSDWRSCNAHDPSIRDRLRGRVVLVGENVPGLDQHETVIGTIPGVRLQANYIEALLDDDVFQPLPEWVTFAYTLLLFGFVEVVILSQISWKYTVVITIVLGAYVMSYLVVTMTGLYLNPGIGIVAALVTQLIHSLAHSLMHRSEQRRNQRRRESSTGVSGGVAPAPLKR